MLMLGNKKNKKAVSLMVSYVILISIGIALAILVYGWMKFYTSPDQETRKCPDQIALIIDDYSCDYGNSELNLTIKNQGLFTTDGFIVKIHNRPGAEIGFYALELNEDSGIEEKLTPREKFNISYDISEYVSPAQEITVIELQSFLLDSNNEKILCPQTFILYPN